MTGSSRLVSAGWWLVGSGDAGAVVACSEEHLHEVLANRTRHQALACCSSDEEAYA
jgi:uncharacterized membrane protein